VPDGLVDQHRVCLVLRRVGARLSLRPEPARPNEVQHEQHGSCESLEVDNFAEVHAGGVVTAELRIPADHMPRRLECEQSRVLEAHVGEGAEEEG